LLHNGQVQLSNGYETYSSFFVRLNLFSPPSISHTNHINQGTQHLNPSFWVLDFGILDMSIYDFLRRIDYISHLADQRKVANSLGGLITLLTGLILLVFALTRSLNFISNDPATSTVATTADSGNRLMLIPEVLLELQASSNVPLERVIRLRAWEVTMNKGQKTLEEEITLVPCNVDVMESFVVDGYCLDTEIYAQGVYGSDIYTYAKLDISYCSNISLAEGGSNMTCYSIDEMNDTFRDVTISVSLWINNEVSHGQWIWTSPIYQHVNPYVWLGVETNFVFRRDREYGVIYGSEIFRFISYRSFSLRSDVARLHYGSLMSFYLHMNGQEENADITRYTLLQWLTEVGGVLSLTIFFTKVYNFSARGHYHRRLSISTDRDSQEAPVVTTTSSLHVWANKVLSRHRSESDSAL
jgi:hypothetical protein